MLIALPMFWEAFTRLSRCALAGLALVAATYHLTQTAHRQTIPTRPPNRSPQPAGTPPGKQKPDPRPRPVLGWLAPDMLNRNVLRAVALDEQLRRMISGGSLPPPCLAPSRCEGTLEFAQTLLPGQEVETPTCQSRLSDRSIHGPPGMG